MTSALRLGGGIPSKADKVIKLIKGGCVNLRTRGGSKNPKILRMSCVSPLCCRPYLNFHGTCFRSSIYFAWNGTYSCMGSLLTCDLECGFFELNNVAWLWKWIHIRLFYLLWSLGRPALTARACSFVTCARNEEILYLQNPGFDVYVLCNL